MSTMNMSKGDEGEMAEKSMVALKKKRINEK
jgi:hypothetical protein